MLEDGEKVVDSVSVSLFELDLQSRVSLVLGEIGEQRGQKVFFKNSICSGLPPVVNCESSHDADDDH